MADRVGVPRRSDRRLHQAFADYPERGETIPYPAVWRDP